MIKKGQHIKRKSARPCALLNESGLAVVFALGLLALLFMLASSFVVSSMASRKIASRFSAETVSRLAAQSVIKHVMALIRSSGGEMNKDLSNAYLHSVNKKSISNKAKSEFLDGADSLMNTVINDITHYSVLDKNSEDKPDWLYLFNHGVEKSIIARMAYVALSDLGKIDPSACVDSGENAQLNSVKAISEYNPPSEATMIDSVGKIVIGRPGRSVNELFLDTLPYEWFKNSYAKRISSKYAPGGRMDLVGGGWNSRWTDLF